MDKLFVLPTRFEDKKEGGGLYFFCGDCAMVQGFLTYFPSVKEHLNVKEVSFSKPRKAIVDLLGEANQSCPVLVLNNAELDLFPGISIHQYRDQHFINNPKDIARYLAAKHKVSFPH